LVRGRDRVVAKVETTLSEPLIFAFGTAAAILVTSPVWSKSLMASEGEMKGKTPHHPPSPSSYKELTPLPPFPPMLCL
jgi:hypothetical protein